MTCENCKQESRQGKSYTFHFGTRYFKEVKGSLKIYDVNILGEESPWICDNCVIKNKREDAKMFMGSGVFLLCIGLIVFVFDNLIGACVGFFSFLLLAVGYDEYKPKRLTPVGENLAISLKRAEIENSHKGKTLTFFNSEDYSEVYVPRE